MVELVQYNVPDKRVVVQLEAFQFEPPNGRRFVVKSKPFDFVGSEIVLQRIIVLIDGQMLMCIPFTVNGYEEGDDEDEQSEEEDDSIPLHENRVPE